MNTMNLRSKWLSGLIAAALMISAVALAVQKGDTAVVPMFGTTCALMDDGGTAVATAMFATSTSMTGRNTILIANPSGSSGTVFCGWSSTVSSTTGMPVVAGGSLSIDITCGAADTAANCPRLYCTTGSAVVNQTTPNCNRWMQVR